MLRTGCSTNVHMLQESYGTSLGPHHFAQLPVAIAQPAESVYQQLPAIVYLPAAAASLHSAADIYPSAVSSSVEPKISTCLLLWVQFKIGEAQLQRAFLSSGLQL